MMRRILSLIGLTMFALSLFPMGGCGDDIRQTKSVERHEQEPVRMVSPGTEVVE